MNRNRIAVVALSVGISLSPALAAEQAPASAGPPKPAPEMSGLEIFLGKVSCSGQQNDSPFGPAHPLQTVSIGTLMLDGFRLTMDWSQQRTKENPNPLHGIFDVGYDPAAKRYFSYWGDAFGGWGPATSPGWRGDALVFTGELNVNGQKLGARDTFVKKSNHEFTYKGESQGADGSWLILEEETCRK
jgi:hypothetical protein